MDPGLWSCWVDSCLPSVYYAPTKEVVDSLWILALDDLVQDTLASSWL